MLGRKRHNTRQCLQHLLEDEGWPVEDIATGHYPAVAEEGEQLQSVQAEQDGQVAADVATVLQPCPLQMLQPEHMDWLGS